MFLFLIPLVLGFALVGARDFTAAYSRLWDEHGGEIASFVLRKWAPSAGHVGFS